MLASQPSPADDHPGAAAHTILLRRQVLVPQRVLPLRGDALFPSAPTVAPPEDAETTLSALQSSVVVGIRRRELFVKEHCGGPADALVPARLQSLGRLCQFPRNRTVQADPQVACQLRHSGALQPVPFCKGTSLGKWMHSCQAC